MNKNSHELYTKFFDQFGIHFCLTKYSLESIPFYNFLILIFNSLILIKFEIEVNSIYNELKNKFYYSFADN